MTTLWCLRRCVSSSGARGDSWNRRRQCGQRMQAAAPKTTSRRSSTLCVPRRALPTGAPSPRPRRRRRPAADGRGRLPTPPHQYGFGAARGGRRHRRHCLIDRGPRGGHRRRMGRRPRGRRRRGVPPGSPRDSGGRADRGHSSGPRAPLYRRRGAAGRAGERRDSTGRGAPPPPPLRALPQPRAHHAVGRVLRKSAGRCDQSAHVRPRRKPGRATPTLTEPR